MLALRLVHVYKARHWSCKVQYYLVSEIKQITIIFYELSLSSYSIEKPTYQGLNILYCLKFTQIINQKPSNRNNIQGIQNILIFSAPEILLHAEK